MDLHIIPQIECGRFEQILAQFLLKCLHIILDSRIPSIRLYGRRGEVKKSDKWFNLVLGDCPAVLENLDFWRRNLMEPMIIDIILVQETPNSYSDHNLHSNSGLGTPTETIIERWVVQYEHLMKMPPQTRDASDKKVYRKSIVLLRSLYSILRLLPAYKVFQKLSSLSQANFDIMYQVSVYGAPSAEEDLMEKYSFVPVDARQGYLTISVTYRESLSDFNLDTSASVQSKIITDYLGSPLTDPLRVSSLYLEKGLHVTSSLSSMDLVSSTPCQHPQNFKSGPDRGVSLTQSQPFTTPLPLHCASSDICGQRIQENTPAHHKPAGFKDYQLSPPFSLSPSPCCPTHLFDGYLVHPVLHSETSLVSIPHPMMNKNSRYVSPNLSNSNRHGLPPLPPKFPRHDLSSQESPSGMRSLRKPEPQQSPESSYGITSLGQKVSGDAKVDSGKLSGLLSFSGSPCVGFSRRSSRISFQYHLDEAESSFPFIADDVDIAEPQPRENLGGREVSEASLQALPVARKSQDSDVAALLRMLRTARPLRQDTAKFDVEGDAETSSGSFMPLTVSDGLEELKAYKEMMESIISIRAMQEGKPSSD